jgi:hypothetical protein
VIGPAARAAVAARTLRQRTSEASIDLYENLCRLVREVEEDMKKATGGNKAAGTRVRKSMQDIKDVAQQIRQRVLEMRGTEEGGD